MKMPDVPRWRAGATVAALLAGVVISGCGSSGPAATTPAGPAVNSGSAAQPTGPAGTTTAPAEAAGVEGQLYEPPISGACRVWPGVIVLRGVITPLQTAVNATDDFGPGSDQANSDDMALNVAILGLAGQLKYLPTAWGEAIFNQVVTPADSHDAVQMSMAATNAESLASDIGTLCYVPA